MAQLYKFCKTILGFSAKNILFVVLFALKPAFGVIGDPTVVEIPPLAFSELHGIKKPKSPVMIKLDGNKVDLSPVMQILEQSKKSHYNNYEGESLAWTHVYWIAGRLLCDKLPEERNIEECRDEMQETIDTFKKNMKKEMSERILYPWWYTEKEPPEESFESTLNSLDSNSYCWFNYCFDSTVRDAVMYSPKAQYARLYDKIKRKKSKRCHRILLTELAKDLEYKSFPKKCLQTENKNHPVCKDMLNYVDPVRERFLQLTELAYGPEALKTTEAKALCFDCVLQRDGELNELLDFMNTLEEQSQCLELKFGEEKIVHPGTGLDRYGSYTVQKESDGAYLVALNLEFSADEDYDGAVPKERVPEYYLKKVQRCIRKANEGMLGPNGKRLRIAIKKSSKKDACQQAANATQIHIGSEGMRSNASKYRSDIGCSTIIHEVLHLLGLCDEYKESSMGVYTNPKTGETVRVNSQGETFNSKGEKIEDLNLSDYDFKLAFDCRVTHPNSIMSHHYRIWPDFVRGNRPSSLLTPGQFNSILYGECPGKNKLFNECSQLAYRDSGEPHLSISGAVQKDCIELKKQCESQNVQGFPDWDTMTVLERRRDLTFEERLKLKEERREEKRRLKARNRYKMIRKARERRKTERRVPGTNLSKVKMTIEDLPDLKLPEEEKLKLPVLENPDSELDPVNKK